MGWNGSKSGLLGAKMGEKWVETHFTSILGFRKNPFFSQLKGGWKLFSKKGPEAVPTQHNPTENAPKFSPKFLSLHFVGPREF